MFLYDIGTYTAPVKTYSNLDACLPDEISRVAPDQHLVTVKTCNNPQLLARSLSSLTERVEIDYVRPLVIDDSKDEALRTENEYCAVEYGATYGAVLGRYSLVGAFSEYIARTEPSEIANELTSYLERIATDYPKMPDSRAWGGVAGAQNMGHLMNVMQFGETQTPRREWLSTFIDDDVIMPPNAQEIFQMIGLYHNLGNISLVAGGYLHHSGNPIALAHRTLKYLIKHSSAMTQEDIQCELDNLSQKDSPAGFAN